jgi:hypothetical protein
MKEVRLPLWVDTVAKVENRKAPKISRMLIFGELYRCNASQRRYEGPRLLLREMMWSLTFPRTNRISGLYNFRSSYFRSSPEKDFFNTICQKRPLGAGVSGEPSIRISLTGTGLSKRGKPSPHPPKN